MKKGVLVSLLLTVCLVVLVPIPSALGDTPSADEAGRSEAEYWGQKRRISVMQMRDMNKEGKYEAGLFGGVIPNDPFVPYGTVGVRAAYFLSEAFAVEATYAKPIENRTDLEARLRERYPQKIYHVQVNDIMDHLAHINMTWTPITGKVALLSDKLSSFDLGISMGAGWLFASYRNPDAGYVGSRKTPFVGDLELPGTPKGNAGLGFRFFLMDWIVIRADVNQYFFAKAMGGLSHPTMVSIGAGAMLPNK